MINYCEKSIKLFKEINSVNFFLNHSLFDIKKFVIFFSSGVGGEESNLFIEEIFLTIKNLLSYLKISFIIKERNSIEVVNEKGIFDLMFAFMGIHRIQRVPKTEKKGRIHTSTISLLIVPSLYFSISENFMLLESDVKSIPTTASVKAGGQRLNHINTALRMIHIPTKISIVSQDQRDQSSNYKNGLKILQKKLLEIGKLDNKAKMQKIVSEFVADKSITEKDFTYNYKDNYLKCHRSNLSENLQNILNIPKKFYNFLLDVSFNFHKKRIDNL